MKQKRLLFQGDSNTDWNRNKEEFNSLGDGYVSLIDGVLNNVEILNRGVSGDRAVELLGRWQADCLALEPDYLSIFVGINEIWHKYTWGKTMTTAEYEMNLRNLIGQVNQHLPQTKILLMTPFALPIGAYLDVWNNDLMEEIKIVKQLAEEYDTLCLDVYALFTQASETIPLIKLTEDGVHPTRLGHQLLANAVLELIQSQWQLS